MEKSSKLKNSPARQSQKKTLRNPVILKQSSVEVKPRIQRLCTISGIPAKNPIPHGQVQNSLPVPLDPPKPHPAYLRGLDSERKGSWESILASNNNKKGTLKALKNTAVPSLLLSPSSARSPVMNIYNHMIHHDSNQSHHDTIYNNAINFHNFDPIRTLQFLTLELKSRIKMHLPDEMNLHRIVTEIQLTIKRLSTVSTSTAIIETTSMVGGDDRRIIREDYHSFSGGDSVSGQITMANNNRKKYKNQVVQTESMEKLLPPPPPNIISRGDNTDSRHSLKNGTKENNDLEISNIKLQHEVSKYHDELNNLRKRQHKLESSLKSRDHLINKLQKELNDIEILMKDQLNLMFKDNIYIDLKSGGNAGDRNERANANHKTNTKLLNNISASTSLTNLQNLERSTHQKDQEEQQKKKHTSLEYEKLFSKPQLKSPGTSPPTLITPRITLSAENNKGAKENNRRYTEKIKNGNEFYHDDDDGGGDSDDDLIRSKKKFAAITLRRYEPESLKEINIDMDEIKAIIHDVKSPSPPRKFQPDFPSFI